MDEIGDQGAVTKLIESRSDDELARLMNNLGGHDLPSSSKPSTRSTTTGRPASSPTR
jgi:pyruvate dehydrogenase E1 component